MFIRRDLEKFSISGEATAFCGGPPRPLGIVHSVGVLASSRHAASFALRREEPLVFRFRPTRKTTANGAAGITHERDDERPPVPSFSFFAYSFVNFGSRIRLPEQQAARSTGYGCVFFFSVAAHTPTQRENEIHPRPFRSSWEGTIASSSLPTLLLELQTPLAPPEAYTEPGILKKPGPLKERGHHSQPARQTPQKRDIKRRRRNRVPIILEIGQKRTHALWRSQRRLFRFMSSKKNKARAALQKRATVGGYICITRLLC